MGSRDGWWLSQNLAAVVFYFATTGDAPFAEGEQVGVAEERVGVARGWWAWSTSKWAGLLATWSCLRPAWGLLVVGGSGREEERSAPSGPPIEVKSQSQIIQTEFAKDPFKNWFHDASTLNQAEVT